MQTPAYFTEWQSRRFSLISFFLKQSYQRPLADAAISYLGCMAAALPHGVPTTVKTGTHRPLIVSAHLVRLGLGHAISRLSRVVICLAYSPSMTFITIRCLQLFALALPRIDKDSFSRRWRCRWSRLKIHGRLFSDDHRWRFVVTRIIGRIIIRRHNCCPS